MQRGTITIEAGIAPGDERDGVVVVRADRGARYIIVRAPSFAAIKLQRLHKGAERRGRDFLFRARPEIAADLEWFRQRYPLDVAPESAEEFSRLVARYERKRDLVESVSLEGYAPPTFDLAIPPRDYQRLAADLAVRSGALLVGDSMGLGKTVTGICTLVAAGALPALIVTLTSLTRQWEAELARFAPALRVHRATSGTPSAFNVPVVRRRRDPDGRVRMVTAPPGMPDVIILNYAKLPGWSDALVGKVRTLVLDEAQELRHSGTRRHDAAVAVASEATTKIELTGTPVYNYGDEIHSVLSVIDPDALGDRREFVAEWCSGANNAVTDPRALGSYLRERGLMIRRTREDVGREIPKLSMIRHVVDADLQHLEREAETVAELARRVIARAGTPVQQMHDASELDWRLRQATGVAKAHEVAELVRLLVDAGERVLLGGWHHAVYALWRAALDRYGITHAMFTGEQSDVQKAAAVEAFKAGRAQVLMMSLRAGAGLDGLQYHACTAVVGELDWSPKVIEQFVARLHRDGQRDKVAAYYCVTEHGSDPKMEDVLGIKAAQAAGIENPADESPIPAANPEEDQRRIRILAEDVLRRRREAAQMRSV